MAGERSEDSVPPWRLGLAPGEDHGFASTPGWWDLRDVGGDEENAPRLRAVWQRALPPLPDGAAVLDAGAGTGTLIAHMAGFYPGLRYTLLDANGAALERTAAKLVHDQAACLGMVRWSVWSAPSAS